MGNIRYTNNASGLLSASVSDTDTSLTLGVGQGDLFPLVTGTQYAIITVEDALGNYEIMRMTARAGNVLTVTRGQEGTIPQSFASGSRVELRVTAEALNQMLQSAGDTVSGELDFTGGGSIKGALIEGGEIVGVPMRGDSGVTSNQLLVPPGGAPPTIGGSMILTVANVTPAQVFPVGSIIMWHGTLGTIPAGWQLCDGTNGTPDLRNRFVVGAGDAYAWQATGGSNSAVSGAGGAHTPTIQGTALTAAQLPSHDHRLWVWDSTGGNSNMDGFQNGTNVGIGGQSGDPANNAYRLSTTGGQKLVENAGTAAAAHTHTADAVPDHTHTVDTRSPYYALFFIMRV